MKLPPLMDDELQTFLREGLWVAKIATHNPDGSIRMTPLTYAVDDNGDVLFTTWQDSDAVRNLGRDPRASVLIDKVDEPYAGVHYTGHAQATSEPPDAEEYVRHFGRYLGDPAEAAATYKILTSLGLGDRARIRFHPEREVTWDFAKIPQG